jgi:hypothetical protein
MAAARGGWAFDRRRVGRHEQRLQRVFQKSSAEPQDARKAPQHQARGTGDGHQAGSGAGTAAKFRENA